MVLTNLSTNVWRVLLGLLILFGIAVFFNVGELQTRLPLISSENRSVRAAGWTALGFLMFVTLSAGNASERLPTRTATSPNEAPSVAVPPPAASTLAVSTQAPTPTTAVPTQTAAPPTPAPTRTPAPTPPPTPSPIVLSGRGQTATDDITLRADPSRGTFTHDGRSNFVVYVYRGTQRSLLINEIGSYRGERPLTGSAPFQLSIEADGPWTLSIQPPECCATSAAYVGRGDAMSNQFNASGASAWQFEHDGSSNFVVYLHCRGSRQLIQNDIGRFSGSKIVVFGSQPCWWEVMADGNWSIRPR